MEKVITYLILYIVNQTDFGLFLAASRNIWLISDLSDCTTKNFYRIILVTGIMINLVL